MEEIIRDVIRGFVLESPENRFPNGGPPFFEEPLIGFAAADDPYFTRFKEIIGDFHCTPAEIMENSYGPGKGEAKTVICWILPITRATRESNRREEIIPSYEWAMTRSRGERFNTLLRSHLVDLLRYSGAQAVAPLLSGMWRLVKESPVGVASTWSERHAAFVAGLGSFSLNDGLITEKGIAHRCGSVITDAVIPPTTRASDDPWEYCLHYQEGGCGLCIPRCPVGAITPRGHDKDRCLAYAYGELRDTAGRLYGTKETGCGLCQTKVPCEYRIPPMEKAR